VALNRMGSFLKIQHSPSRILPAPSCSFFFFFVITVQSLLNSRKLKCSCFTLGLDIFHDDAGTLLTEIT